MDIVIDTNVIISAVKSSKGASFKVVSLLNKNQFRFHISTGLLFQYEASLKHINFKSGWNHQEIDEFLDLICLLGVKQEIRFRLRPMLQDVNDEFIAELALSANVDCIVTHNVKDFTPIFQFGIQVLTPQAFLKQQKTK